MRKIYGILILLFCFTNVFAQQYYYWAYDKKYPLELYAEKQYVLIKSGNRESVAQNLGISQQEISDIKLLTVSKIVINKRSNKSINGPALYWGFVSRPLDKEKVKTSEVIYAAPSFLVNGKEVSLSQFFYVKLKQEQDIDILENLAKENNVEIVGNDSFMPLWYILSCDKNSKGNALEMANL